MARVADEIWWTGRGTTDIVEMWGGMDEGLIFSVMEGDSLVDSGTPEVPILDTKD